jgi:tRNA U34 5-methylaminomethyl-2-thiouridine-forming methyltransferase MnmC
MNPSTRAGTDPPDQGLQLRTGADGSFSLWSTGFGEGFHSGRGALREARETFLNPSQLQRFRPGATVRVVEVCVGTGCNLAVLLEACAERGLALDWIGLELDPEPLRLALSQPAFRAPWQEWTLRVLERLQQRGCWQGECGGDACPAPVRCQLLWGDARSTLPQAGTAGLDLIWHDAFSPQRCPQLWSLEFLARLTSQLRSEGRWISYCSAAAVREALRLAGLQLVALHAPDQDAAAARLWSGGTMASPDPLPASPLWRQLTPMERDHLACAAAEPYRDPAADASAGQILRARGQVQALALAEGRRGSSSAWRRRWGLQGHGAGPKQAVVEVAPPGLG